MGGCSWTQPQAWDPRGFVPCPSTGSPSLSAGSIATPRHTHTPSSVTSHKCPGCERLEQVHRYVKVSANPLHISRVFTLMRSRTRASFACLASATPPQMSRPLCLALANPVGSSRRSLGLRPWAPPREVVHKRCLPEGVSLVIYSPPGGPRALAAE